MRKSCPHCGSTDFDEWYMTTCHTILSCKEWDESEKKLGELKHALKVARDRAIFYGDRLIEAGQTDQNRGQFLSLVENALSEKKQPEPEVKAPECDHHWGEPILNNAGNAALHWCSKCSGSLVGTPCKCCGRADHGGRIVRINPAS
jgi:hypothetical protein